MEETQLTIKEYIKKSARTCPDLGSDLLNEQHMYLGIITESGEVFDVFKKNMAYGKELDLVNILEESIDNCWYLANSINFTKYEFDESLFSDIVLSIKDSLAKEPVDSVEIFNSFFTNYVNADFETWEELWAQIYCFCDSLGLDFYKGLQNNVDKLLVRFPEGFTNEKALSRNLEAERNELEK